MKAGVFLCPVRLSGRGACNRCGLSGILENGPSGAKFISDFPREEME